QESLALDLRRLKLSDDGLVALAEGLLLGSYGFTLKPSAEPRPLTRITIVVANPDALRPALDRALVLISAVASARDLVNTPALEKNPSWLAAQAKSLLKGLPVTIR